MPAPPTLQASAPARGTGARFAASLRPAALYDDTAELRKWLDERRAAGSYQVSRIPFAELDHWSFDAATGNLQHDSGQFFTVEGLTARTDYGGMSQWSQPILNQPEIGILGILVKETDGVLHCLMQAKMEPGNFGMVQLSPTVQATRSNIRRVHKGGAPRYLEYFTGEKRGRPLVDVVQSEQGSWFYAKRNRNMVVEADGDVAGHPDFRWVPLHQLFRLLVYDNFVNMDTRTVLSCMPFGVLDAADEPLAGGQHSEFTKALRRSFATTGALHGTAEQLSWFNDMKVRHELAAQLVPLRAIKSWRRTEDGISRPDGRDFSIVAVSVAASNREVAEWTQPLLAPSDIGLVAFVSKQFNGVLHVLAHARVEIGYRDTIELGPTVQSVPEYGERPSGGAPPRYLDYVLSAPPDRIRLDTIQSDEGGRLLAGRNRHVVIEAGDDFPVEAPDGYEWLTVHQLITFMQRSYHVNIQGRSLAACLASLAFPSYGSSR